MRSDFFLEAMERDVVPVANEIEAADLDSAELRVIEGSPRYEAVSAELLVAEAQQPQLILGRMISPEPRGSRRSFERNPGSPQRIPEFGDE